MIEGKTVRMGDKDWIVPPLNFKALRKFRAELQTMSAEQLAQSAIVVDMIHAALTRNYPDLTTDALEDMLDMGNVMQVTEAVLGVSGLVERQSGEAPAANLLTGANSTVS